MADYSGEVRELKDRVASAEGYLGLPSLIAEHAKLSLDIADPDLWGDPANAKVKTKRFGDVSDDLSKLQRLRSDFEEIETAYDFYEQGELEFEVELLALVEKLKVELSSLEVRSLLSGEFDERDAVCEIHAGAGGTDAQDWAEMMLRMYLRFAESRGFEVELDEVTSGQEAGILSATFIVKGRHAYGLFTAEKGVHRLVRISPFDGQKRRQTSFASFEVIPFLEDPKEQVEIDDKDLRIDTYRSSGAGGQHVNVTDSAVRITHLPTGTVVSCQNERSQHQNKAKAMQILGAKLAELIRLEHRAQLNAISGPQSEVGWGSQIRSYVMAPYQLVKDHRSNFEDGNVQGVLDGNIEPFMDAYLMWRRAQQN